MPERREDEFYVGYLPRAPRGIAARTRLAVAAALLAAVALAVALVSAQSRFAPSVFEFGVVTEHVGVVRERPYPVLEVLRPGSGAERDVSTYYLSAFGKRGAGEQVAGFDGKAVRLRGSLVYRDDRTMIEVEDGSVREIDAPGPLAAARRVATSLGRHTLLGEIVDSKCFLGVMKPGNLKPHRACAARCISGGVPPVLLVRNEEGEAFYFLLVSADGGAVNREVLDLVAEPVEITGEVVRQDDLLILRADPSTYRRIGERQGQEPDRS